MRHNRAFLWVGLGVVLGLLGSGLVPRVETQSPSSSRLSFAEAATNSKGSTLVFIRDSRTAGCWLGVDVRGQGITSLAAAPSEACR